MLSALLALAMSSLGFSASGCARSETSDTAVEADAVHDGATSAEPVAPKPAPPKKAEPIPKMERLRSPSRALEVEQLLALGYVDGTYDPHSERRDVLVYDKKRAQDGYNFYSSRRATGARLIDMDGRTVHQWKAKERGQWQHSELLPSGDALVIVKDHRLSRYDKDSKLIWSVRGRFHAPKKDFFSLTRGSVQRLANGNTLITESDTGYVFEVTPRRKVVWQFANPVVSQKGEREAIWRMTRFEPKSLTFLP